MTFRTALKATYGGSIAFLIACPLLALIPVAFELLQHVIEVRIGMYDGVAAARAVEHHPLRMAFGMLKIAALTIPAYWITRFLPDRDARFAAAADPLAIRLFAIVFAVLMVLAAVQLFAVPQTLPGLLIGFFAGQVIASLLLAWTVAAPLGNPMVGPTASIAIMARQVPWTIAFSLVAMLPLMIPHYIFGALAIVGPRPLMWPILIVDSLLVGWLTAVLVAAGYFAATRAAASAGIALVPSSLRRDDARRTAPAG